MITYKVKSLSLGGKWNTIFKCGDIVTEKDFNYGQMAILVKSGFVEPIIPEYKELKIGVVCPTIKGRELFLNNFKRLLKNQTLQPDVVEIIDSDLKHDYKDVAERYLIGFKKAFSKGCDVVLCMEDDDYYSPNYIEYMIMQWVAYDKPVLFGLNHSTYYHILRREYFTLKHPNRSSMMCTLVSKEFKGVKHDVKDPYLDISLWQQYKGVAVYIPNICVGIKHGLTEVAGGCHSESQFYKQKDENMSYLSSICNFDVKFYKSLSHFHNYKIDINTCENPILTIITRKHGNKRPGNFAKHRESISTLKGKFEQIFIEDNQGLGMELANSSFQLVTDKIKGEWVYLLDDDDGILDYNIIKKLKDITADLIIVKGFIGGKVYPPLELWGERPQRAQIGGSNIIVKKHIFVENIIHFSHIRMGDFEFIDTLINKGVSVQWLDTIMFNTFKVSRGTTE